MCDFILIEREDVVCSLDSPFEVIEHMIGSSPEINANGFSGNG